MCFVTVGGLHRCRITVAPDAPLAGVYDWLRLEHRAGRLGLGVGRVDVALPGGKLLSEATTEATVQSAFGRQAHGT